MKGKWCRIAGCMLLIFALSLQSIAFAEEAVQPEGTTDNDIYGLDVSAQYERKEKTETVNLSFDDIEDITLAKQAEFLIKMGFANVTDGKFRPDDDFTRYEMSHALQMIANMANYVPEVTFNDVKAGDERLGALAYAYKNGFLSRFNDYTIRPDMPVSANELLYAMLGTMGYKDSIDTVNQSGADGLLKVAKRKKLLVGITYGKSSVSRAEAVEFIYNAISEPVNEAIAALRHGNKSAYELEYENYEEDTLLSVYHDIYKREGWVNATLTSGLGDYSAVDRGQLRIDDLVYNYTDVSMIDFFGYNTEFYYRQDGTQKNEGELVYMLKSDDVNEIIIPSDEIKSYENNVLTYYDKGKKRSATVDRKFELIRNGKSVKDCLVEEIIPKNGTVTLVANNGGNKYDTMIVWEYYNAVAEGISADGSVLEIAFKNGQRTLEYDIENVVVDMFEDSRRMPTTITTSYYYDGDGIRQARVSLPNVPANSLLSIFADSTVENKGRVSASDDALYIRLVVNTEVAEGVLTSERKNSDGEFEKLYISSEINGKKVVTQYDVSEDNFLSESEQKIDIGTNGKFCLDYLGKIASCTVNAGEGDLRYGYLINAGISDGLTPVLKLKILTVDDEIVVMNASENVKINDSRYKDAETAFKRLSESAKLLNSSFTISQLIKYAANSENLVSRIETVTAPTGVAGGYDDNHLRRENVAKDMVFLPGWGDAFVEYEQADIEYNGEQKNERIEMTHYIGQPNVFFSVPNTETFDDDKLFSASDKWPSEGVEMLPTELYDVTETKLPQAAIVYAKMQNSYLPKPIVVVDKIYEKNDEDGELRKWIAGYAGAGGYVEYAVETEGAADNVEIGDIIFAIGKNSEIYDIEHVGNALDIAKMDISAAPLKVKSKNKAPETDFYLYTTMYEAYDFDADTKTLVLQNGKITDGDKREYQRASWWVNEWRNWGGAITIDVDSEKDKLWIRNGTYGDLKCAYDYSNKDASKILLIEHYGYGMRFIVIVNEV